MTATNARIQERRKRRQREARIMQLVMACALALVVGGLFLILTVIIIRGIGAISWQMLTDVPHGGSYSSAKGGIFNSILGSFYLAVGGTLLALLLGLPIALYLNAYAGRSRFAGWVRLGLDVMWGIPSLLYGAFGFAIMIAVGLRASLLAGIVTLSIVELPILTRGMDEVLRLTPRDLHHGTLALGATRWELMGVLFRQALPGLFTATLLAFGRGIGDAAAVLFTAGYTDRIPTSLTSPTASLPLTVFFQLQTPYEASKARAYAAALVLTAIILLVSVIARFVRARVEANVVR
jgi:phosphate transport system permease protein